mgnify:CR=1 FL=1
MSNPAIIPSSEFIAFKTMLRRVDWNYLYAEGQAYYNGQAESRKAGDEYARLIAAYPDSATEITAAYKAHGRDS